MNWLCLVGSSDSLTSAEALRACPVPASSELELITSILGWGDLGMHTAQAHQGTEWAQVDRPHVFLSTGCWDQGEMGTIFEEVCCTHLEPGVPGVVGRLNLCCYREN